jgi:hypothetical protein
MALPLSLAMYSIILDAGKQEENEELSEIFYSNIGTLL